MVWKNILFPQLVQVHFFVPLQTILVTYLVQFNMINLVHDLVFIFQVTVGRNVLFREAWMREVDMLTGNKTTVENIRNTDLKYDAYMHVRTWKNSRLPWNILQKPVFIISLFHID